MTGGLIPVLWVCGPPGVRKSTLGWQIFSELTQAGTEAGYVDIDQLGMCYPEPATDPGRHQMKERNLAAVVTNYHAAGARCIVVSGVVDPGRGVQAGVMPRAALTVCRLRADPADLTQRLLGRGEHAGPEVLVEAAALDASDFADFCVDTSGLTAAEVTRLVRGLIAGWPDGQAAGGVAAGGETADAETAGGHTDGGEPGGDGRLLVICGATGVGKSAAGFEVFRRTVRAGQTAAYLDLDQIGFRRPARADDVGNHQLKALNLAAMWRTFRDAGAQCLIAVGPVDNRAAAKAYADAIPRAAITLCRLHAGADELKRRIMLRGQGGSWPQPGDPLAGRPAGYLLRAAAAAAADAEALERAAIGAVRVDSGPLTVEQTAATIAARTGWPALFCR